MNEVTLKLKLRVVACILEEEPVRTSAQVVKYPASLYQPWRKYTHSSD